MGGWSVAVRVARARVSPVRLALVPLVLAPLVLAPLVLVGLSALASPAAAGVTVTLTCFSSPGFAEACRTAAAAWERRTGNTVRIHYQPEDTTDVLAEDLALLEAGSAEVDVFQVDVIWPGVLGRHFVDLAPFVPAAEQAAHFPQIVANNTVDGRLVAMPWYTDVGVLYYRTDLLARYGRPPPATWDELEATARAVVAGERARGDADLVGYLWQGRAYEGLTCNALEWIDSHGGGTVVEEDGRVSVDSAGAVTALRRAAAWMGTITPWAVLFYGETESRDAFRDSGAVFLRNWPFAWSQLNAAGSPVAGRVGVAALPRGGRDGKATGTLGGWQLAVSRHSANVTAAADLVRFMTGREEQKRRAIRWAYSPTIADLYGDPEVLAATPFLEVLRGSLEAAVARPSRTVGPAYATVSRAFWTAVHATLSGHGPAERTLGDLAAALRRPAAAAGRE